MQSFPGRTNFLTSRAVQAVNAVVTLAELNTGKTLVEPKAGVTLKPIGYRVEFTGTFTTATDIRLSDTASSPVDVLTIAIAQATDGDVHVPEAGTHTEGAGFCADLTQSKGIQVRKTGSSAAGGTSINVTVFYLIG